MRQQYRNTEKRGGHSKKNKQNKKQPNTNPRVQVKAKCFCKRLKLLPVNCSWSDGRGVGIYFGCQNIPSKAKEATLSANRKLVVVAQVIIWSALAPAARFCSLSVFFCLVLLLVLQTALWMAQYTGKTRTALCAGLVRSCPWLLVLPVTVHWLRLVPLGKNPHSDSACSRTCPPSLGG